MNTPARSDIASFARRLRLPAALLCLAAGAACLWAAADLPFSLPGPDVASADASFYDQPLEGAAAEAHARKKILLQASVDGIALSLSATLPNIPDEQARRAALARALDALTFELGSPAYFTAWEGTRLIHSPMTPDAADMDFIHALDSLGRSFIRAVGDCLEQGGGFVQVILPRRIFDETRSAGALAGPQKITSPNTRAATPAAGLSPALLTPRLTIPAEDKEVMQVVYSRAIPGSGLHISAFMDVEAAGRAAQATPASVTATAGAPAGTFSSAWAHTAFSDKAAFPADDDLQNGLAVSGLSFAGIAGVLLFSRRRQE